MFELNFLSPELCIFRTDGVFLEGVEFSALADNDILHALGVQRGYGYCYEIAAMAMFALANNHTARLVHGLINDEDPHAWVEFYDDSSDAALVLSPTYFRNIIVPAQIYLAEDDWKIEEIWSCNFDDFWDFPLAKELYALTESPETSKGLLGRLEVFRPDSDKDFGFKTLA